jgi:peptidoglycan glycosyltransferase
MNRALKRLSLACLAMFVLLLINVNYVQGFEADSLAAKPGNVRTFNEQFTYQRGSIVATGDGGETTIAESVPVKSSNSTTTTFQRSYPDGPAYAPVTGYDSIFGATGAEAAYQSDLAGTAPGLTVHNLISLVTGKPKQGATVMLTISPKAQQAAYTALSNDGGHDAAAVAIDPSTGAILAMASVPSYDPNELTTHNGAQLNQVDKQLLDDPSQPLLNRAINATYPPGSTFKIITSAAAFTTGQVANTQATIAAPQPLTLPNGNQLNNDGDETCGDGQPQIIEAFWLSCDTAFAKLGINLGSATLQSQAEKFGWNSSSLQIPMSVSPSEMPLLSDASLTGMSAIGQYNDTATPLQEAMDAAAIANNGTLMKPYLLKEVQAPDLASIDSTSPSVLSQAVTSQVASEIGQMMVQVTTNPAGTAYATANPSVAGVEIAGKTGTAQNGINNSGLNDAVFTCYAPYNDPKIAVGVMVQGGGFGADAAAPIAVKIIQAYLGVQ